MGQAKKNHPHDHIHPSTATQTQHVWLLRDPPACTSDMIHALLWYCRVVISTSHQWGVEITKLDVPPEWKGTRLSVWPWSCLSVVRKLTPTTHQNADHLCCATQCGRSGWCCWASSCRWSSSSMPSSRTRGSTWGHRRRQPVTSKSLMAPSRHEGCCRLRPHLAVWCGVLCRDAYQAWNFRKIEVRMHTKSKDDAFA